DRVKLLRLSSNSGVSVASNAGIAAASGELIAFLDADDEWLPGKLATQAAVLRKCPNATMVVTGCRFLDASDCVLRDEREAPDVPASEIWRLLLARTLIARPSVLARADALRAAGPFDTQLAVGEDQDMWIRLALLGEVMFVPDVLTVVHETAGSLTKRHADTADRYLLPMIRHHVDQQRHRLSRREIKVILGERYTTVGRNLYAAGAARRGALLLAHAMLLGHHVLDNLWYLLTASPPSRTVKRMLRW
ncbi:MAG TPA: glycosyltransferase family 2 protein, partial [Acetobacteraceae bacterium]|nr:glycosyltransferase family 2 protein [Acetobacteraceae bacterium]